MRTQSLPRFTTFHCVATPCASVSWRSGSPSGGSILMTRAPQSAKNAAICGAAASGAMSRTVRSASAITARRTGRSSRRARALDRWRPDHVEDAVHDAHQIEVLRREDGPYAERLQRRDVGFGNDAADDHRDVPCALAVELLAHQATHLEVRPRQHRQADHAGILLDRRRDDLLGREADAAVDDLEAGVPGGHRDHLRTVRMPVEPGLPDDDPWRPAVCGPPRRDPGPHAIDPLPGEPEALPVDTRRRTVLTEHRP